MISTQNQRSRSNVQELKSELISRVHVALSRIRPLSIGAMASLLLMLCLFLPQVAQAQSCTVSTSCPGVLYYAQPDISIDDTCLQTGGNQYNACLSGVSTATPNGLLGGAACCVAQYDIALCACGPNLPDPGPGPVPVSGPGPVPQAPNKCGDPVDPGTGIFTYQHTDLTLPDVMPIRLTRVYREFDTASRTFGIGMVSNYYFQILGDESGAYAWEDLVLPDGGRIHYTRTAATSGTDAFLGAVYQNTTSPTIYYESTLTWDNDGWLLTLKNGTQMFFQRSLLTSITDRNGNQIQITRDQNGNLTQITSPNGRWIKFTLGQNSRVDEAEDSAGRTIQYAYNSSGYLSTVYDANGGVTKYSYNSNGYMVSYTTPNGNVHANNQYDSNGRVIQQTQPDGGVFGFTYTLDSNGNVTNTAMTDPNGSVCSMAFDSNGFLTSDTWASGTPEQETLSYTRDPNTDFVLSTTDSLNRTTSYTYDSMGNVTSVTRLAGTSNAATTSFTYDPNFNQVTSITDPLNNTWTIGLDANGNPTSVTDPLGDKTTITYNSQGQPLTVANAAGDTTSFSYNNGELASVTDPLGNVTSFTEDAAGLLATVTDPLGDTTSFNYDPLGDLTRILNAAGGVTSFTYDGDQNLLSVTDANGNKTTYTYDSMDRLASRTDALGAKATYSYDGNGNLTQFTDRRGVVTDYQYDALNRLTFVGYGANGSGQYDSTVNYTYDAGDRLTQAVDSIAGTIQLTYDGLNDLLTEQTPQGSVAYTYNLDGLRTSMTPSGQAKISYTWDQANRLIGISQGTTSSVGFTYDTSNRRTQLTLPNGMVLAYTYDADSRITAMNWTDAGSQVGDLEYTYDKDGRVIAKSGSFASVQLPAPVTGNTFNADNEMTAFNGTTLSYDADGHLTSDGTNSYVWGARGHLTAVAGPNIAAYQYDAFGRRVQNTLNGVMTQYLYDGLNPVEELDGASPPNVVDSMLTGLGIDEYFARTNSSGTTSSYLTDALGSTLALADSSGALTTEYTYEPFGKTTVSGSSSNPFQFTGRENDGTGLYYYRARYYSPTLQRFISQDPIGFAAGDANVSAFVSDNPISLVDPLGLTSLTFDPVRKLLTVDPQQPGRTPYDIPATSGRPHCHCDARSRNSGPIPSGKYHLYTKQISQPSFLWNLLVRNDPLVGGADWGGWRVPLHPNPGTNTFGRGGFFLHEGYLSLGSAGCINVGGGLSGNPQTDQLLKDLRSDPDGVVPVTVK